MKAVLLYIKYDRRVAATIRDLGYPTPKTLRTWYEEYLSTGGLHRQTTRKAKFSKEQQQLAVDYYLDRGRSISATIRALGYPNRETLRNWIHQRCPDIRKASMHRRHTESFSEEQKRQAVIELCVRDGSAENVAKHVGVSRMHLYAWRNKLLGEEALLSMKTTDQHPPPEGLDELVREVEDLRQRVHRLQMEHDILVKANELLKKDQGINPHNLTNREKTLLIDALRATYRLSELLIELRVPKSCYFYHRSRLGRSDKYIAICRRVNLIFQENRSVYGYRRIHTMLRRSGTVVSEKVIRRIMIDEKLIVKSRRKRRYSAYQGEISPAVKNVIQRDFHADVPNQKWLTDITEFQLQTGKVYLSPIIDCFDGLVVSWAIGTRPDASLVNTMLENAVSGLNPNERPIVHSDRGSHYRWPGWINRMRMANLTRSMSKKGCTSDNAACEGFFGRLKNEMYYNRNWGDVSTKEFIDTLDEYIHWYNNKRIKLSLGGMSPVEYRVTLGFAA